MKKNTNKRAIQRVYLQQTECSGKKGVKTQLCNLFPTLSMQVNDILLCVRCHEGREDQECRFKGEIISFPSSRCIMLITSQSFASSR